MPRRQPSASSPSESSSVASDYIGSDVGDGVNSDTDLSDNGTITDNDDEDEAWLSPHEDHSPEHYLQQLAIFDEKEYTKEDYKDSSTRLLDRLEDQWNQYVSHLLFHL